MLRRTVGLCGFAKILFASVSSVVKNGLVVTGMKAISGSYDHPTMAVLRSGLFVRVLSHLPALPLGQSAEYLRH